MNEWMRVFFLVVFKELAYLTVEAGKSKTCS